MAHVFIVDKQTFDIHLKYKFAGTGSKNDNVDFLFTDSPINVHTEKKLISLYSDISRIRIGDKIVFFVTGISKFYGVFTAESEVFIDNSVDPYLTGDLEKKLIYRILISSEEVYPKGVSEYMYLDSTKNISRPQDMTWSLIYRKLKGNRGCTAINSFELNKLIELLKTENNNTTLNNNKSLGFENGEIVEIDNHYTYQGSRTVLNNQLVEKMIEKDGLSRVYEYYLQAYIIDLLKQDNNCITHNKLTWIGNEVSCGVGMQSIDIMAVRETENNLIIYIIELKAVNLSQEIVNQVNRYLLWVRDYIIPLYGEINISIVPIVIGKKHGNPERQDNIEADIKNQNLFNEFGTNVTLNEIFIMTYEILNNSFVLN